MSSQNGDSYEHIVKTSAQWRSSAFQYKIIPRGILCVELTPDNKAFAKIGEGNKYFAQLPYIGSDIDLSEIYTKLEIDQMILFNLVNMGYPIKLKGSVDTKDLLPKKHNDIGDVYYVKSSPDLIDPENIMTSIYVWNNKERWDMIGFNNLNNDLSKYATIEYVDEQIEELKKHQFHDHENKEILDQITCPYTIEKDHLFFQMYEDYPSPMRKDKLILNTVRKDLQGE